MELENPREANSVTHTEGKLGEMRCEGVYWIKLARD
jgi:hypothetical protein